MYSHSLSSRRHLLRSFQAHLLLVYLMQSPEIIRSKLSTNPVALRTVPTNSKVLLPQFMIFFLDTKSTYEDLLSLHSFKPCKNIPA